jgi:hypothetical protein
MAERPRPVLTRRQKTLLKIERRAWLRFPSEEDILCLPGGSRPIGEPEVAWMGKVRDISLAGIGLAISPIIAVHKWFARRPGTLFRAPLLAEFTTGPLREEFFAPHEF